MNLTAYTDYSLRVLMYLKTQQGKLSTASEVSQYFQLSQNHIGKVINNLGKLGLIETIRGKGGGIRLLPAASNYKIGDLVRILEPERKLVQCVDREGQHCAITRDCRLAGILDDALDVFWNHLNQYTLDDIVNTDISVKSPAIPIVNTLK